MAAGFENIVNINGYGFRDVTNETFGGFVLTYEQAYAYTLGWRPRWITVSCGTPKEEKKDEKK